MLVRLPCGAVLSLTAPRGSRKRAHAGSLQNPFFCDGGGGAIAETPPQDGVYFCYPRSILKVLVATQRYAREDSSPQFYCVTGACRSGRWSPERSVAYTLLP